jgi:hypothetical protein
MKPGHLDPRTTGTLGAQLERDRLALRTRRLSAVIAELRRQAGVRRTEVEGGNRHVQRAIVEFEAEVTRLNARLTDLAAASVQDGYPLSMG